MTNKDIIEKVNVHSNGTKLYLHIPEDKEAMGDYELGDLMLLAFFARANEDAAWGEDLLRWFNTNEVMENQYPSETLH